MEKENSELFLDGFDFLRYGDLKTKMGDLGIRIRPLSELMKMVTVVDRPYRRQGVATAMKLRAFKYVQELGKVRIEATNAETNPMLHLNLKLGFKPIYAWLEYKQIVSSHGT